MEKTIIFLALIFSFSSTYAQINNQTHNDESEDFLDNYELIHSMQSDFLVPSESLLNSEPYSIKYNQKIKETLFKGLPDYFDIQYFSTPSFDTERVLVIYKEQIYYNLAQKSIWATYYEEIIDETDTIKIETDEIKVNRYQNKISEEDAELVNKLYRAAISKARFRVFSPDELNRLLVGNDGTTYSFSIFNNGIKEGTTWSPNEDSKMFRLVEIHKDIIDVVMRSSTNSEIVLPNKLEKDIKKLIDEINLSDLDFEKETINTIKDTIVGHLNKNLPIKELINDGYTYVENDLIFTISKGKIKKVKEQEPYYDNDYSKFRNWFNNLIDKDVTKHYKRALKNLDLSYLNLELDLNVYIDFMLDKKEYILKARK